jgi:putative solute:sodium symporter small subunit
MSDPGSGSQSGRLYWRRNLRLIAVVLAIWFTVSFGFAIFLAEPLGALRVGRLPMGFWWPQQGAMLVFVALIFVYARRMDRLDREHGVDERPAGSPDGRG